MHALVRTVRRLAMAATWFAVAAAIAFGSAGVVAGLDHVPGRARPELTWAGDREVRPLLDRATDGLALVAGDVDELGRQGRGALAALVGRDDALLERAIAEGALLVERIDAGTAELRRDLLAMPGFGTGEELRIGAAERERHAALDAVVGATADVKESWAVLSSAGRTATRMVGLLEAHDRAAFAATAAARSLDYAAAVEHVAEAEKQLAEATALRDRLRNTVDTSTLDEWLRRSRDYDAALRRLYTAFRDSKGRVTDEVREAIEQERVARAQLPEDNRPVGIIVAEIARGGATGAVIRIEEARGRLAEALAALRGPDGASAEPSTAP